MPKIEAEFEVWCDRCGAGLCGQCRETRGGITIEPCENCLNSEYNEGYDKGYDDGKDE